MANEDAKKIDQRVRKSMQILKEDLKKRLCDRTAREFLKILREKVAAGLADNCCVGLLKSRFGVPAMLFVGVMDDGIKELAEDVDSQARRIQRCAEECGIDKLRNRFESVNLKVTSRPVDKHSEVITVQIEIEEPILPDELKRARQRVMASLDVPRDEVLAIDWTTYDPFQNLANGFRMKNVGWERAEKKEVIGTDGLTNKKREELRSLYMKVKEEIEKPSPMLVNLQEIIDKERAKAESKKSMSSWFTESEPVSAEENRKLNNSTAIEDNILDLPVPRTNEDLERENTTLFRKVRNYERAMGKMREDSSHQAIEAFRKHLQHLSETKETLQRLYYGLRGKHEILSGKFEALHTHAEQIADDYRAALAEYDRRARIVTNMALGLENWVDHMVKLTVNGTPQSPLDFVNGILLNVRAMRAEIDKPLTLTQTGEKKSDPGPSIDGCHG